MFGVFIEVIVDIIFVLIFFIVCCVVELVEYVKVGCWKGSIGEVQFGVNVYGKMLGLIGMGCIGFVVVWWVYYGFGMFILYYNCCFDFEVECEFDVCYVSQDELLVQVDFVCVMLFLNVDIECLIGVCEFVFMKCSVIFINVLCGCIVDEVVLIVVLQDKIIYGVGLDVFEVELLFVELFLL